MRKETINIKNRENKYFLIKKNSKLYIISCLMLKNDKFNYTGRLN